MTERGSAGIRRRDAFRWAGAALATSALAACTRRGTPPGGSTPATGPSPAASSSSTLPSSTLPGSTAPTTSLPGSSSVPPNASANSSPGPPDGSGSGAGSSAPTSPSASTLAQLSAQLSSPVLLPGSSSYATSRRLYNPRFDAGSNPAAIAKCSSVQDLAACVRFAASSGTALRIRSGGHSYGGWSSGTGLVADVSRMSSVAIDTASRTARIGAGAKLADVYSGLAARGLALAAGSCPTVGMAGLTLGGGVGVLSRAYGLTCDAVQSVEIVTADGTVRTVSATADPDLYWALRGGGGGSFGAVSAFTVSLRPAPTVATFYLAWDIAHAETVIDDWQSWIARADRRLWSTCKVLVDPGPGTRQVTVSGTWIGPAASLGSMLSPLLSAVGVAPATDQRASLSYPAAMLVEAGCSGQSAAQCTSAALTPARRQPFAATSAILASPLPAEGISAAVAGAAAGMSVPGLVEGGLSLDALGGAVADVPTAGSAFVHRHALASVQYTATWKSMDPASGGVASPAAFDSFVRAQRANLTRWTGAAAYVNYADPTIADYGRAYWGSNYARLQSVKRQYDPHSLFTFPQAVTV